MWIPSTRVQLAVESPVLLCAVLKLSTRASSRAWRPVASNFLSLRPPSRIFSCVIPGHHERGCQLWMVVGPAERILAQVVCGTDRFASLRVSMASLDGAHCTERHVTNLIIYLQGCNGNGCCSSVATYNSSFTLTNVVRMLGPWFPASKHGERCREHQWPALVSVCLFIAR